MEILIISILAVLCVIVVGSYARVCAARVRAIKSDESKPEKYQFQYKESCAAYYASSAYEKLDATHKAFATPLMEEIKILLSPGVINGKTELKIMMRRDAIEKIRDSQIESTQLGVSDDYLEQVNHFIEARKELL